MADAIPDLPNSISVQNEAYRDVEKSKVDAVKVDDVRNIIIKNKL